MIDETKIKELLDIFEETFDTEGEVKDIVSGARVRIKEAKTVIKDWSEKNELNPKTVARVYKDYKEWRAGNLKWGETDDYAEIQVSVMDKAVADSKEK